MRSGHDFDRLNEELRRRQSRVAAERDRRRHAQQVHSHHLYLRSDGSYGTAPAYVPAWRRPR